MKHESSHEFLPRHESQLTVCAHYDYSFESQREIQTVTSIHQYMSISLRVDMMSFGKYCETVILL